MDANTYYAEQHHRALVSYDHANTIHEERMTEYKQSLLQDHDKLVEAVATYLEDAGDLKLVAHIIVAQANMGDFALHESQAVVRAAVEYDARWNGPDWKNPDELADEEAATYLESKRHD